MATIISGLEVLGPVTPGGGDGVVTPDALALLAELEGRFGPERQRLLAVRTSRQARIAAGVRPGPLPETQAVREAAWTVTPPPRDLQDRRVEIAVPPAEGAALVAALNSGAGLVTADLDDGTAPTWAALLDGQANLCAAVCGTLEHTDPDSGKTVAQAGTTATLQLRPRGWHLDERHVRMDGEAVSAALFDAALFLAHNARALIDRAATPCLCLPKLEGHFEARLWNEALTVAEEFLHLPHGAVRVTVMVETIHAALELDEIVYELRERCVGLSCGPWDHLLSLAMALRDDPAFILPDRAALTTACPPVAALGRVAVRTGHRRGVPVTGGMVAALPVPYDTAANDAALAAVRAEAEHAAAAGHDGARVADPALVEVARAVFDTRAPASASAGATAGAIPATAPEDADLLAVPAGPRTAEGLHRHVAIGLAVAEAWLDGSGRVALFDRIEDAATADVSRITLWQWQHHAVTLADGATVTDDLVHRTIAEELAAARQRVGAEAFAAGRWEEAARLFGDVATTATPAPFLALPLYDRMIERGA